MSFATQSTQSWKKVTTIATALASLGIAITVVWIASRQSAESPTSQPAAETVAAELVPDQSSFDFGTIAMADGIASHSFTLTNNGDQPVRAAELYTSCMCTEATLTHAEHQHGPFGMPGHGMMQGFDQQIAPGETATIDVAFDPNAHGPAGVGLIERVVTLVTDHGSVDLAFSANVIP